MAEEAALKKLAEENARKLAEEQRLEEERLRLLREREAYLLQHEAECEERERTIMQEEDVDANSFIVVEVPLIEEVGEVQFEEVVEEIPPEVVAELPPDEEPKKSYVATRIDEFFGHMAYADGRNLDHQGREPDDVKGKFFIPQSFGPDIHFDPFEARVAKSAPGVRADAPLDEYFPEDKLSWSGMDDEDPSRVQDDKAVHHSFDDIGAKVVAKRLAQEQVRSELFKTSDDSRSPSEWTQVYRLGSVHWEAFMRNESERLHQRLPTPEVAVDPELDFQTKMKQQALERERYRVGDGSTVVENAPGSLVRSMNDGENITPLPFGRVAHDLVIPGEYKYYQVGSELTLSTHRNGCNIY